MIEKQNIILHNIHIIRPKNIRYQSLREILKPVRGIHFFLMVLVPIKTSDQLSVAVGVQGVTPLRSDQF